MNIEIKPMSVEEAHKFVSETLLKATYYYELTHEAALARIEFFYDCLTKSILKNKEEWGGFRLSDFNYVATCIDEMKETIVKDKFAQTTIDTQKDKIVIDGVQVNPINVNLDIETEFVYQMGQNAKPHKKHKKLTIEWSEPCESNPVHTVAPPPPPPTHYISEMNKSNFSLFGWLVKPKEQAKTQKEKEQEEQIAAILAKKIEARKEGRIVRGYQSIVKIID